MWNRCQKVMRTYEVAIKLASQVIIWTWASIFLNVKRRRSKKIEKSFRKKTRKKLRKMIKCFISLAGEQHLSWLEDNLWSVFKKPIEKKRETYRRQVLALTKSNDNCFQLTPQSLPDPVWQFKHFVNQGRCRKYFWKMSEHLLFPLIAILKRETILW